MINEFITYLRDTKGKADNTLVAYKRDVISFAKFLEGHSGRELAECKESDSIAYILELNNASKVKGNWRFTPLAVKKIKEENGMVAVQPVQNNAKIDIVALSGATTCFLI